VPEVIRVADPANRLGESPAWHPVEHALYWVDIERPSVERLEPDGSVRRWPMPEMIGSIAFRKGGGLVAAMRSGFHFLDLESGTVDPIVDPARLISPCDATHGKERSTGSTPTAVATRS
jgi:sugar lactone lactonase YvrE